MQPIPVVLVAGFLGAGKTTLMRRLIMDARARGLRAAVIVNEFGAEDIDSNILRQADAELLAGIAGGCACCSGQDELTWALQELGSRPDSERPDVILLEASGLADPLLLLDVLTAAQLLAVVRLGAIVALIDAEQAAAAADATPHRMAALMKRQLELADWLVVNKADLVANTETLAAAMRALAKTNGRAQIVPATEAVFDYAPLWRQATAETSQPLVQAGGASDSLAHGDAPQEAGSRLGHATSQTVSCPLPHPVERAALMAALCELGDEVWRAKGFVRLRGEAGMFLLQYTGGAGGGRATIAPFYLPPLREEPPTILVFIGAALDSTRLRRDFAGLGPLLNVM